MGAEAFLASLFFAILAWSRAQQAHYNTPKHATIRGSEGGSKGQKRAVFPSRTPPPISSFHFLFRSGENGERALARGVNRSPRSPQALRTTCDRGR